MTYLDLARPAPAALVLLTSLGYVAATLGLKVVAGGHPAAGIVVAVAGLALACVAEILLMRTSALSMVYVAILGVETVLILAVAYGIGEGFTLQQGMGAAMVLAGLAVLAG